MDARTFYDELAPDYDALHADWPRSVRRQGEVLDPLIRSELGDAPQRVLDCACGIGTQAIGLALRGHDVLATDLSPGCRRARRTRGGGDGRDARDRRRRLHAPAPSRSRARSPACWRATTPSPICTPTRTSPASPPACAAKLEPGGLALVSLRDYAPLVAERAGGHPVRVGPGTISFQVWEWDDDGRSYELAQFTLRGEGERWQTACRRTRLRALLRDELCGALDCCRARGRALAHARGDRLLPADRDWPTPLRSAATVRGMRFSPLADRLARDDTQAWNVHRLASERRARGEDVIMLTIGDPDFETPPVVVEAAYASMRAGRTHYAYSQGDATLRGEIAKRASAWAGRTGRGEPRRLLPRRAGRDVLGLRLRARRG